MKICVDAGHGGNDTGAGGPTGLNESDVVLELAKMVGDYLEYLGQEVKYTRTSDKFIELEDRCAIANNWGADYFVSIHCNSDGSSAVGIETLYASDTGESIAKPVQQYMLEKTGDVDRGLKYRDNLYVLNGTNMPAILAEVGFISHPETESKLKTHDYKVAIAKGIVKGLGTYLGISAPPPSSPPPASSSPPLAEKMVKCPKCGEQFKVTVS